MNVTTLERLAVSRRTAAGARPPCVPAAPPNVAQLPARTSAEFDGRGLCGLVVRSGDPDAPRTPHHRAAPSGLSRTSMRCPLLRRLGMEYPAPGCASPSLNHRHGESR